MDAQALLTAVESAITALLSGGVESYSIGNRSVTKLDLKSLLEERRLLQSEVARSSGSGAFSFARMGRTSR